MAEIFVVCVLHCCTRVLAPSPDWLAQDKQALEAAQEHCRLEHKCLTTFKKVESGIYSAICGEENNR